MRLAPPLLRGNAPWLGATNQASARALRGIAAAAPQRQGNLGQLRGLARAGFTAAAARASQAAIDCASACA
jgi:hypothetical protein